jgi:hypothetical protein
VCSKNEGNIHGEAVPSTNTNVLPNFQETSLERSLHLPGTNQLSKQVPELSAHVLTNVFWGYECDLNDLSKRFEAMALSEWTC